MPLNFNGKLPVIAPGSTVLVTGANGFIGSHVANELIQAGYLVRGTCRDIAKNTWLTDLFDKKHGKGKFEAVLVKDMAEDDAFDDACKGVSGVVHVASVLTLDHDPNKVVPAVVKGAINAATSAAKESSVKRLVYTSSSRAITATIPNKEFTISTDDWNDEEVEAAWKPPPYEKERAWAVYGASKTQAEREVWKFVKENKPGFILNTVLPNANFGEIFSDKQTASTGGWVRAIYNGNLDAIKDVPPQWMVNVKDTARIHVAALLDPDVENERILAFAYPFNWNDVLATLRKLYPNKKFPASIENELRDLSKVDNSRGAGLLKAFGRPQFTGLEESIRDNTENL